tara:strand:- start:564 stop:1106 length:543 start_codon:yes stop_codon:yes gene_type:complete
MYIIYDTTEISLTEKEENAKTRLDEAVEALKSADITDSSAVELATAEKREALKYKLKVEEEAGREKIKYYPIIYYSFSDNDNINKNRYKYFTKKIHELEEDNNFILLYKNMNDKENVYNKNNINILLITIIFIWLSILLIILKILSKILGENYGKVMLVLTIILLIIGVIYSLFIVKKKM